MNKNGVLKYLQTGVAVSTLGHLPLFAESGERKPNIIFILADDLGYGELGCYGNTFNETPNIDRLAAEGMRFTAGYAAAPVCSPTRAAIMTGMYPSRTGITDYLPPAAQTDKYLEPEKYVTLNEALAQAGYRTGMIGKWHLDTDFNKNPGGPAKHGWHEVIGTETDYIGMGDYVFPYSKISTFDKGAEMEDLTSRLFAEGRGFISRNVDRPFFLYLSLYAVHVRLDAPFSKLFKYCKKYDAKYGEGMAVKNFPDSKWSKTGKPDNPWLAGMLDMVDDGVGSIMAQLKELGIDENTYVIFYSDNGGDGAVANNGPLRGAKGSLYEGGVREPLIIRRPGAVPSGKVCAEPVSSIDFYPTFCAWAGAPLPKDAPIDGINIAPALSGRPLERGALYWYYLQNSGKWTGSVRKGNSKLILFDDGRRELYDLLADEGETRNLAEERRDLLDALSEELTVWRDGTGYSADSGVSAK